MGRWLVVVMLLGSLARAEEPAPTLFLPIARPWNPAPLRKKMLRHRAGGGVLLGVGLSMLVAVATGTGYVASFQHPACNGGFCVFDEMAEAAQIVVLTAGWLVGAAATAGGGVLIARGNRDASLLRLTPTLALSPSGGIAGARFDF